MSKLYGFFNSDLSKTTLTKRGHNKISCKLQSYSGSVDVTLHGDNEVDIKIDNLNVNLNGKLFRPPVPMSIGDIEEVLKNSSRTQQAVYTISQEKSSKNLWMHTTHS